MTWTEPVDRPRVHDAARLVLDVLATDEHNLYWTDHPDTVAGARTYLESLAEWSAPAVATNTAVRARRDAFPGTLPDDLTEAAFLATVVGAAKWLGWRVNHQRPAQERSGRWSTATTGHRGVPDLTLAKDGRVILAELKTNRGRLGPGQGEWLEAIGGLGRLWRPRDWPQILAELAA